MVPKNKFATNILPIQLPENWSLRLKGAIRCQEVQDNSHEFKNHNSNVNGNINAVSSFSLLKGFTLEFFGAYKAPNIAGIVIWEATNIVDFSLQKKFNKASFALTLDYITNGGIFDSSLGPMDQLNYNWTTFLEVYKERILRLNFSTSFGDSKLKAFRTRDTAGKEEKSQL